MPSTPRSRCSDQRTRNSGRSADRRQRPRQHERQRRRARAAPPPGTAGNAPTAASAPHPSARTVATATSIRPIARNWRGGELCRIELGGIGVRVGVHRASLRHRGAGPPPCTRAATRGPAACADARRSLHRHPARSKPPSFAGRKVLRVSGNSALLDLQRMQGQTVRAVLQLGQAFPDRVPRLRAARAFHAVRQLPHRRAQGERDAAPVAWASRKGAS